MPSVLLMLRLSPFSIEWNDKKARNMDSLRESRQQTSETLIPNTNTTLTRKINEFCMNIIAFVTKSYAMILSTKTKKRVAESRRVWAFFDVGKTEDVFVHICQSRKCPTNPMELNQENYVITAGAQQMTNLTSIHDKVMPNMTNTIANE